MRRSFNLALLGLVTGLALVGCGSNTIKGDGNVTTTEPKIQDFDAVKLSGNFVVHLNGKEAKPLLQVKADQNIQPYITAEIKDHVLTLAIKKGYKLEPTASIQITADTKRVNSIEINGVTTLVASELVGEALQFKVSGTSTSILQGAMKTANYDITGTAHLNASDLFADEVKIKVVGTAQASVKAKDKLSAYIKGASQVTFYGAPPVVDQEVFGGGRLIKG